MANVSVVYQDSVLHPVKPCETVKLCLDPSWAAKTVSGNAEVLATVQNGVRYLGGRVGAFLRKTGFWNARNMDIIQYDLQYDDAQITDPVADVITCGDITQLDPYC